MYGYFCWVLLQWELVFRPWVWESGRWQRCVFGFKRQKWYVQLSSIWTSLDMGRGRVPCFWVGKGGAEWLGCVIMHYFIELILLLLMKYMYILHTWDKHIIGKNMSHGKWNPNMLQLGVAGHVFRIGSRWPLWKVWHGLSMPRRDMWLWCWVEICWDFTRAAGMYLICAGFATAWFMTCSHLSLTQLNLLTLFANCRWVSFLPQG